MTAVRHLGFSKILSESEAHDLILIGGQGLAMDYSCGKFGDCSFSRCGVILRTNTKTHTDTQTSLNALLP